MNLNNFLKSLLQSAVNAALPSIKTALADALNAAVAKDQRVPAELKLVVVSVISSALDAWTIKL